MAEVLDVLVVDDDPAVARLVQVALRRAGLGVRVAADGPAALAELAQSPCRVVLVDYTMPGMTGLQVLREAESAGCRAAFLLMSAFLDPETERTVLDEPGVAGMLRKPFDLAALVRDVLTVSRRRGATAPRDGDAEVRPAAGQQGGATAGSAAC